MNWTDTYTDYESPKHESCTVGSVAIERVSTNQHYRIFHTRIQLGEGYISWERSFGYSSLTSGRSALIDLLSDIRGIETMSIAGYQLRVTKGHAFSWDEVQPQIVQHLEKLSEAAR